MEIKNKFVAVLMPLDQRSNARLVQIVE